MVYPDSGGKIKLLISESFTPFLFLLLLKNLRYRGLYKINLKGFIYCYLFYIRFIFYSNGNKSFTGEIKKEKITKKLPPLYIIKDKLKI